MVAIVLVILIVILLGAAYGLFTRRGSDISEHPRSEERR